MAVNELNRPLKVSHFAKTALKALFLSPSGARGREVDTAGIGPAFFRSLYIYKEGENKVEADTQIRIAENGVIRRLNPVGEEAL